MKPFQVYIDRTGKNDFKNSGSGIGFDTKQEALDNIFQWLISAPWEMMKLVYTEQDILYIETYNNTNIIRSYEIQNPKLLN